MRTIDFTPLHRSSVGFDHIFNLLEKSARDEQKNAGYPPYNIEALENDEYQITLAVAGFAENDITIESNHTKLTVSGKQPEQASSKTFLHQGIAGRDFERTFELAEHVHVTGANLKNGLLTIDLVKKIPDAMKPRQILIGGGNTLDS